MGYTRERPSTASIISGVVAALAVAVVTGWIVWHLETLPELAGVFLGMVLSVLLLSQAAGRWAERDRRESGRHRRRLPIDRIAENTGVWSGPQAGQRLVVRWDDGLNRYWVTDGQGTRLWGAGEQQTGWLADYARTLEEAGWTPDIGIGTRAIRAQLDLPGWDRIDTRTWPVIVDGGTSDRSPELEV